MKNRYMIGLAKKPVAFSGSTYGVVTGFPNLKEAKIEIKDRSKSMMNELAIYKLVKVK